MVCGGETVDQLRHPIWRLRCSWYSYPRGKTYRWRSRRGSLIDDNNKIANVDVRARYGPVWYIPGSNELLFMEFLLLFMSPFHRSFGTSETSCQSADVVWVRKGQDSNHYGGKGSSNTRREGKATMDKVLVKTAASKGKQYFRQEQSEKENHRPPSRNTRSTGNIRALL